MTSEFLEQAKLGDRRSLARILSALENGTLHINDAIEIIGGPSNSGKGHWQTLAITGAPGVGKSCLLDGLLRQWAKKGVRVAVLAVDPTSPRTGGALLGDRVRMTVVDDVELNDLIYLRSVATRKASGSVPFIVEDMTKLLLALGWQRVIIETVGAGQSEVRCAAIADRIVVVEGPARGDGIQAEKAGLLELADAVLVNKSDLPGAELHADEIRESFELGVGNAPPVLLTSAVENTGILEAAELLLALSSSGRSQRARWRERLLSHHERKILESPQLEELLEKLAKGSILLDEALQVISGGCDE
ncbi:MAG: methylmalonyl Co-A mutase-associated GTPase MeaB [Euryarchaeota archaeon]|jgi:LAO/AO transport system kinase|nr:methylmalonyl Co-A mutase-associated GTPase MeaB [Euryarchaeota archaeon]MBT5594511.1 methylmalonyl Co-A mutase-associated GTPase MeaB [Euryarchaeota archaeon]MBT5844646.1 methylmalonyl Co-A mutase-associated GTPase MeaB [Euryarchaeota archaeon]MBT6641167.1 methylmalonyl Co-A mutase-associated GTPase MeaB [Euryarchaeota archaeon]MBT6844410.1 methylmalonyl Co-A mutase-associated GTPase MeaB [Euryarchaeota archaeon]